MAATAGALAGWKREKKEEGLELENEERERERVLPNETFSSFPSYLYSIPFNSIMTSAPLTPFLYSYILHL